ncbi:MAG: adenylyl-sulfate kinase, partial [Rhodospirillales bacterium]|nr:adenylyl-sulfate kinase [Rhodospirillales bacterium]
ALLLIDAEEGIKEQSRRHGYLLHLLGVRQVMVVVNKMDLVAHGRDRFESIERDYRAYLQELGVTPTHFIPVSARHGDNIAQPSESMAWYRGPTVLQALDEFQVITQPDDLPLRFPVQDVYRFDERRIIAGRIETGVLRLGDNLLFSPANRVGKVKTIEAWNVPSQPTQASAGMSIGITLEEQIFVERGDVASHETDPPIESDVFLARLFWLGDRDLAVGSRYTMKLNTAEVGVVVQAIDRVIDTGDLSSKVSATVARNEVAEITLRADTMQALDAFTSSPTTGRFVLVDDYNIAGGGIISMEGYADQRHLIARRSSNIQRVEHDVTAADHESRNGHRGGVLWFTGLSGAGKSTIAVAVERRLFNLGYQTYVLDGDNVRHGLNGDLGFSPEDRAENIRRVGEVAALISSAGMLCITAFISPYRSDRDRARLAGGAQFAEIFIKADLATCEQRDPKGLYKKARAGDIPDFTGISAPYEAPEAPELVVDTSALSVEDAVERVVTYIQNRFAIDAKAARH